MALARIFRVPPPIIGEFEGVNYSSISEVGRWFYSHTMQPWLNRWEKLICHSLFSAIGRRTYEVEFDCDLLLRGDMLTRFQAYRIARETGIYNANELRKFEKQNPRKDTGDVFRSRQHAANADRTAGRRSRSRKTMITVTEAATKFNLIDVATARSALSITDNNDDPALTAFVDRASDVIARHCRRTFALETVTEQFRPDQCLGELILARYPVIEITSITEGADALAVSDYEVAKDSGIVTRLYGDRPCHWSRQKIIVVYSAGFDLPTSAPDALKHACVQLVKSYYMSADRDPMVRSEMSDNISSASYFGGSDHLPPDVRGLLVQFRNLRTR